MFDILGLIVANPWLPLKFDPPIAVFMAKVVYPLLTPAALRLYMKFLTGPNGLAGIVNLCYDFVIEADPSVGFFAKVVFLHVTSAALGFRSVEPLCTVPLVP